MLRVALRRVLWLVPTIGVATLLAFWIVSSSTLGTTDALPVFLNLEPADVRARAAAAVHEVAEQGPLAERAGDELVRLGGAALPHVLPALDSLDPTARARVARALAPLARRMGLTSHTLEARETATTFWRRYWEDHGIDFRPAIVKRAVRRFAERPSALRKTEIIRFDTYALPELLDELRSARSRTPERVARLIAVLRHVVPTGPSEQDAAPWFDWWVTHRADFVTFSGVARIAAMVRETRYGRWAWGLSGGGLGQMRDGSRVWSTFAARAPVTAWLVSCFLVLGLALGIAARSLVGVERWPRVRRLAAAGALGLPTTVWAAWVAAPGWAPPVGATALTAALGAAWQSRHFVALYPDWVVRSRRAFPARAHGTSLAGAWRAVRPTLAVSLASITTEIPIAVTLAFVVERAFNLHGIGEVTLDAVQSGDVPWLMGVALAGLVATWLCQLATLTARPWLDPRPALIGRRPEAL